MRLKHKMWLNLAIDTDLKDLVYGPAETERLIQTDAFDQWDGAKINLADGDNADLSLAGITNVKGVYLQIDGDAKVKLNGSSDAIQLRRYATTTGIVCKLMLEADITAINVENPSGSGAAMSGHFIAWGSSS